MKTIFKCFFFSMIFIVYSKVVFAQANKLTSLVSLFDGRYYGGNPVSPPPLAYKSVWLSLSRSKNVLDYQSLSYGLDALSAMYAATGNLKYINDELVLINNVINSAVPLQKIKDNKSRFKDNYSTWVVRDTSKENKDLNMNETILSEIYFFQYVSSLLVTIKNDDVLFSKYRDFYNRTLQFTENEIWDKWYQRRLQLGMKNALYMDGRTHTESHWAFIASDLYQLTKDSRRKVEYSSVFSAYNRLLANNFSVNPKMPDVQIWNSTWNAGATHTNIIQDVSHGNLVVSYIVHSYDMNLFWKKSTIDNLMRLLNKYLWNGSSFTFWDNLDGSKELQTSSRGTFQSDGWVKLGRYSRSIQNIYEQYIKFGKAAHAKDPQLYANMALNEKILSDKGL